jgi:hypothetical protein
VLDNLPGAIESWGPTSLVSLAVLLIFLGGLIPRWMHNERIKDKDNRITYLEAALDKRDEQVDALLSGNDMIIQLLTSIKAEAERHRD